MFNRKMWATRFGFAKVGVTEVWTGLLDEKERKRARQWKADFKQANPDIVVMNMTTTYEMSTKAGILATCNLRPNTDLLTQMPVEQGITLYRKWADEYRAKRTTADWELKLQRDDAFIGKFVASPEILTLMWHRLGYWGYRNGDVIDDEETFMRRVRLVMSELKNPERYSDDDLYAGDEY